MLSIAANLFHNTLEDKFAALAQAGFLKIDLTHSDFGADKRDIEHIAELAKHNGIEISSASSLREFGGNTNHIHEYDMDLARNYIKTLAQLDCRLLVVMPPTIRSKNINTNQILADLRALANLAIPYRIKIALKALPWSPYIGSYQAAASLCRDVNSPNFGLVIDTFHFLSESEAIDVLEKIPTSDIFLVQCSDFNSSMTYSLEDQIETYHHKRLIPGDGYYESSIVTLIEHLHQQGYRGHYSILANNAIYKTQQADELISRINSFQEACQAFL
jgi:sugar phosphate isomerase/epimerase